MKPVDTAHIRRRMDRDRVERLLDDLLPYAQKLLMDWCGDRVAEDGTPVGGYRHAWTRKDFLLTDDGRFHYDEHHRIVEGGHSAAAMRSALPTLREWLALDGYAAGDLLEPLDDREFAN